MQQFINKHYIVLISIITFIILLFRQFLYLVQVPLFRGINYPEIQLNHIILHLVLIIIGTIIIYYLPTFFVIKILTIKWSLNTFIIPEQREKVYFIKNKYIPIITHKKLSIYLC